jgi:hypothetical protein
MARALVVLGVLTGVAAASPIRLEVNGDACDLSGIETRVAQLVGRDPFSTVAAAVVRIDAVKENDHFTASVVFDDGDGRVRGRRIVAAKSCADLVESLALILEMALPEPAEPAPVDPVSERRDPPEAIPPSFEASATEVAEPTIIEAPTRTGAVFAEVADAGSSHGWQQRLVLGGRWQREEHSLGIELAVETPQQERVGVGQISVWSSVLTASPCLHLGSFAGCAIVSAGVFDGSGEGLLGARRALTPVLAAGLRLAWEPTIAGRLAFRLHVDLEGNAIATSFEVDHMPVWTSDRVEIWGGAGVIVHFP